MKNLIKGLAIFSMISLVSCTKVLYTQDDVLGRYKTQKDVQKTFGMPTEKQVNNDAEIWLYQFDKSKVALYHNAETAIVSNFGKYDRYLLFAFDKDGNVVRYDYTGIDLAVRKSKTGATIALVGGVVITAVLVAGVISYHNTPPIVE